MSFFTSNPVPTQPHAQAQALREGCPRAAMVVYRHLMGQPHYLLIGTRRRSARLTLPGGKIDSGESALQTAIRETIEEAGVFTDRHTALGTYPHHKANGRVHRTQTYLARYAGYDSGHEARKLYWLTVAELNALAQDIREPIREQIQRAAEALPTFFAVA